MTSIKPLIAAAMLIAATGCSEIESFIKGDDAAGSSDGRTLIARGLNLEHECVIFMVADTTVSSFWPSDDGGTRWSYTPILARPKPGGACKEIKPVDLALMCRIEDEKGILLGGGGQRFNGRLPSGNTMHVKLAGPKPGKMKCEVHPGEGSDVE
jgi:hypothetical protein